MPDQTENIYTESVFDSVGNLRVGYAGLSQEDMESLKALLASPHWKTYRGLLQRAMAEFTRASWKMTCVDDVVKGINNAGLAAGINFSINQVQVLCAEYDRKQQEALEKAEKKPQPFRKG